MRVNSVVLGWIRADPSTMNLPPRGTPIESHA